MRLTPASLLYGGNRDTMQLCVPAQPCRPRLIARPYRTRQSGGERHHLLTAARQPLHRQLPRIPIQRRSEYAADMHIKRRTGHAV